MAVIPLAAPKAGSRSTSPGSTLPDPVGELRFKIELEGITIGHFAECSGLTVEYELFPYQEGGENRFTHQLRGRMKYPNLVLKRGVTHEDALLKWFFEATERNKRGFVKLTLLGEDVKPVREWSFAGAFPVKWQGPTLNAKSNSVATETLEIAHQGFTGTP